MLLHRWGVDDREALVGHGLDWKLIESLPELCGTCDSLYIEFSIAKHEKVQMRKRLVLSFKNASRVRSLISEKIRYAISVTEMGSKLPGYSRRTKYPEIIADLKTLAGFCDHLQEILETTGFKPCRSTAVKKCAALKEKEYLAIQSLLLDFKELKKRYVQSYRNLYKAVQAVRKCAYTVFPAGSERRKGYASQYRRSFY